MIGDLHTHTRLSDGSMSIDDLVFYAKRAGLDFVSITDHDTMEGVNRAMVLGKRYGINIIPGCEISSMDYETRRQVHVLCYMPDKPDRLQGLLGRVLDSRMKAGQKMMLGVMRYFPVTEEHIQRYTMGSKSIYKAHIVQAVIDLGYDSKVYGNVYQQLFGPNGICARHPEYPDVLEVLELVRSAGGISVLAHPPEFDTMALTARLAGEHLIDGVEAFHPRVGPEDRDTLLKLAETHGLLVTGGSDFHGMLSPNPNPLASCVTTKDGINALFNYKRKMTKR